MDKTRVKNRVLDFQDISLGRMLDIVTPKVKLEDIKIGKNFQFTGDRYGVRHVRDVDGEFVLVQTLGHSNESARFYVVHYSHLRPNESPVWDDDNNLRRN